MKINQKRKLISTVNLRKGENIQMHFYGRAVGKS